MKLEGTGEMISERSIKKARAAKHSNVKKIIFQIGTLNPNGISEHQDSNFWLSASSL